MLARRSLRNTILTTKTFASCLQNKAAGVTTEFLSQYLTAQRTLDSLLALILVSLSRNWLAQSPLLHFKFLFI